jgi:hypothetical protein
MSRMDVATIISHSRNLIRDLVQPQINTQLVNIVSNELATELNGTQVFQTVGSMSVTASDTSATIDLSAAAGSKYVGVSPVAITFSASGIRYTPRWMDYLAFQKQYFHERDRAGLVGIPVYWTASTIAGVEDGTCEVEFYPALDKNYTMHFLVNFFPHNVTSTSDYVPCSNIVDHLLVVGCAYYSSRILREDLAVQYLREYEDAVETLKGAMGKIGGDAAETRYDYRRKGDPYIRLTGVAPSVAWDLNPAIPYDPANPNEGRTYP